MPVSSTDCTTKSQDKVSTETMFFRAEACKRAVSKLVG